MGDRYLAMIWIMLFICLTIFSCWIIERTYQYNTTPGVICMYRAYNIAGVPQDRELTIKCLESITKDK